MTPESDSAKNRPQKETLDQRKQSDVSTVEARSNFSDYVNRAAYGKEHVVLTRRGKPVAAIVPIEDLPHLTRGHGRNLLNLEDDDAD